HDKTTQSFRETPPATLHSPFRGVTDRRIFPDRSRRFTPSLGRSPVRLALAAGCALAAVASPAAAQLRQHDFDAYVTRGLQALNTPGASIAVVKDGKVLFAKGYGVRAIGATAPVDAHTLFQIASNTKAFTTAALAMLVDDGKLSWDDPVTRY